MQPFGRHDLGRAIPPKNVVFRVSNMDDATLAHWQTIGSELLAASGETIEAAIAANELKEVLP